MASSQTDFSHTFPVKFAKWVLKYRYLVILGTIILTFLAASGAQHLRFENSYRVFFGKNNPQLKAFDELQKVYSKNDNVMIVLAPKDKQVFKPRLMPLIAALTEESWQCPYSSRVDSITNYQHTYAFEDDLVVEDLVLNPDSVTQQELDRAKEIALNEPLLRRRIISTDAAVTGVTVTLNLPDNNTNAPAEITQFARELVDKYKGDYPDIDFYVTGSAVMSNAFAESSESDMRTLTPFMYGLIIVFIFAFLRSFSATFATILVILTSLMTAMGIAGWMKIGLTPPSATAPTIILTLAIADSVHVLVSVLQLIRKGYSKTDAIIEGIRVNLAPVFLTSFTTIIGFLCLNFSDAPPIHDLGNITAVGIVGAFLYSVTFLPALMSILPVKVKVTESTKQDPKMMVSLADWVIKHYKTLLWTTTLATVVLALFIPKIDLNDEFVKYFDERMEFRQHADFTIKNLTGLYLVEFSLGSGETNGVVRPDYLKNLDRFSQWLYEQPEVMNVNIFSDVMKRLNKTMHGDDPNWYKIPDNRELAAQYLLLYELSLPFGLDINNQVNIEKSSTRVIVTIEEITSTQMREFAQRCEDWLRDNAPEYMFGQGSGPAIMFSHISERNITSMFRGIALALFLITLCLIVSLRSFKYGLLSLIPNVFPIILAFGLWSLIIGQVGFSVAIVASVALGIVVDDTVHFMSKYIRSRREQGLTSREAVRYAFSNVGVALVATSVILVVGFSVLTLSPFLVNRSLGMLSAMTIILALAIDFTLLPALLIRLEGVKKDKE